MCPAAERPPSGPVIDVLFESALWSSERDAAAVLRRAIGEAARTVADTRASGTELAVVLADDAVMRALNGRWRGRDAPTNVLSFPAGRRSERAAGDGARLLGDIVIAFETTAREASAEGKPLADHLAHLAIHGFLHLLGYDHESDDEAEAMEHLECMILARLGIADPYATRSPGT